MTDKKIQIKINNQTYEINPQNDINLSNAKPDNIFLKVFKEIYDISGDGVINKGKEASVFMYDMANILGADDSFVPENLEKYLENMTDSDDISLKKEFNEFLQSVLPKKANKDKLSDKWIVQNNQSLDSISQMILKQTKSDFKYEDVLKMNEQLKSLNKDKLDGSKSGFLVGSEIKLPVSIDTSNEKISENPVYDYVWWTQTKRVKEEVARYNLSDNQNNSELFNDMKNIVKDFMKEYGVLKSSSMEYLLLSPYFDSSEESENNISYIRENYLDNSRKVEIDNISSLVKQYKTANCGECAELVSKMIFDKYKDKYDFSTVIFSPEPYDGLKTHVAVLVKAKDSEEEYVVDTWIDPKNGAIFKKDDWEKMLQKVYGVEKSEIDTDSSTYDLLDKESEFWQAASVMSKKYADIDFETPGAFCASVYYGLVKGKTYPSDVMELFKKYGEEFYSLFNENKGFYEKREIVKEQISKDASEDVQQFGHLLYAGIVVEHKQYSDEIMELFKTYCPDKYEESVKAKEIQSLKDIIEKEFEKDDVDESLISPNYCMDCMYLGLRNGKTYSPELMALFNKYGEYRVNLIENLKNQ